MVDYYFYKLVCNDLTVRHTYVGSTVNFTRRKSAHKYDSTYPKKSHRKIYTTMAANGGWDNWSMVLIEKSFYETKLEAHRHERFYFEQLNSDIAMNIRCPQRDEEDRISYSKQYNEKNKEHIAVYRKEYNKTNKESISAQQSEHYKENKFSINARKKNNYENNKESIAAKNKIYRLDNKEYYTAKHDCICGGRYTHANLTNHMRTQKHQKHQKYIDQIKKSDLSV